MDRIPRSSSSGKILLISCPLTRRDLGLTKQVWRILQLTVIGQKCQLCLLSQSHSLNSDFGREFFFHVTLHKAPKCDSSKFDYTFWSLLGSCLYQLSRGKAVLRETAFYKMEGEKNDWFSEKALLLYCITNLLLPVYDVIKRGHLPDLTVIISTFPINRICSP